MPMALNAKPNTERRPAMTRISTTPMTRRVGRASRAPVGTGRPWPGESAGEGCWEAGMPPLS
ncbi:Uncharacterised protein [Mycobacteroides abscessus subsp. abscessus]|nr:Uncharacterised protein [Mycobacteroides abscessus subsp. abscessus]